MRDLVPYGDGPFDSMVEITWPDGADEEEEFVVIAWDSWFVARFFCGGGEVVAGRDDEGSTLGWDSDMLPLWLRVAREDKVVW